MGKINETTLPQKEEFYSNLNMKDIIDEDFMHAKRVSQDFEIRNLGKYHDSYLKSGTLLLDVLENFRNMCLKIYLDPSKFLSAPGLARQANLKKIEVKLELLTDIDMLSLMVEKDIRGGICHTTYSYAKADNKYMKDCNENKESSYPEYWDVNNLYGWAMLQKLPLNKFEWIKDTSQFTEDFMQNYNEESDGEYSLEVDV